MEEALVRGNHQHLFLNIKSNNDSDSNNKNIPLRHLKIQKNPCKKILSVLLCLSLVFSPIVADPLAPLVPLDASMDNPTPSSIANTPNVSHPSLPIIPDTSNPSYAPSIDKAPNDIEIINITSPNQLGISNNHYLDFNVKEVGAIINNSNNPITPTELGGLISSNPNLGDKQASLILNQVTSTHPSKLLGPLEIAGKQAGLLIANPNGISCEACSFANTTSVSLTTGFIPSSSLLELEKISKQSINSPLSSSSNLEKELTYNLQFRVNKGHINIDSLNSSNIPSLNILSKSLSISHNLYAKNLNIILGSNTITLDQKGALLLWQPLRDKNSNQKGNPKLALDVAYIGGVYANSIYLVASDEDASIRNSGTLATFASKEEGDGGFNIDTRGHLLISAPNSKGLSSDIASSSALNADTDGDDVPTFSFLDAPNGIYANKSLSIKAKSLQNNSVIQVQESASLNLQEDLINKGSIVSYKSLDINATSLENHQAFIYADTFKGYVEHFNNTKSSFILGKDISITSKDFSNIYSMVYTTEDLSINANNISNIAQVNLEKKLISQEHISQGQWDMADSTNRWGLFFGPLRFLKDGDKDFDRSIYQEILDNSSYIPSVLMSAKSLFIHTDVLNNQNASIISPLTNISATTFNNNSIEARKITEDKGREARNYQDVWYEKECQGWDLLTFCIKQTNIRHEKTRLKVFNDYFKESFSPIDIALPSLEETLTSYLKNPYVSFSFIASDTRVGDLDSLDATPSSSSVSNSLEILPSHSLEFFSFNPYFALASKDISKNTSIALKDKIYTDPKAFISSTYFYDHFKNAPSSFFSHLKDPSMLSSFYNSKFFLDESLHLKKLNTMLAHYESIHLENKINAFKDNSQNLVSSDFFHQRSGGILASDLLIKGASFYNDAYIYAHNTKLDLKNNLTNKGSIHSDDLYLSTQGKLYHSGEIVSKNTTLEAEDIDISSVSSTSNAYLDNPNSPKHSIDSLFKVASIATDNLMVRSYGDLFVSGAHLKAKDSLSLEARSVSISTKELEDSYEDSFKQTQHHRQEKSHLVAGMISIKAKEDLQLEESELLASGDLSLYSDKEIHLLSSDSSDFSKKDFYDEEKSFFTLSTEHNSLLESSILQKGNILKASNILIGAKGSIISDGGDYEADNTLKILAGKDYIQTASRNSYSYINSNTSNKKIIGIDFSGNTSDDNIQSQIYDYSTLKGKDIFIQTGADTTLVGVEVTSEANTSISAGGSFTLLNPKNTHSQTSHSDSHSFAGLFSDDAKNNSQNISQTSSSIRAGSLNIAAHQDINIFNAHISTSDDGMILSQKGNINIINDYNSTSNQSSFTSKDFDGFTLKVGEKASAGVDFKYNDNHSNNSQKQALGSVFDIGGNLVLKTGDEGGNIDVIGSDLLANKNILIDSKNVHIYSALNSSSSTEQNTQGHLNVSVNIGNAYADVYFSGDKLYKSLEEVNQLKKEYQHNKELYEQGKISKNAFDEFKYNLGFASLNVANASLALTSSLSAAATAASTSYGSGFYTSVSTDISGTTTHTDEQNTSVVASSLKAGENIFIYAQEDISQRGSHIEAKDGIFYRAKNNIEILSSQSTHQFSKETKDISTNTSYGSNGFSLYGTIGGSRERKISSSSHSSSLTAHNISLSTPKDITINGGVLVSTKADITADNLSIISSSDSSYSHMNAKNISGGYASSSINGGFSKETGNSDREWVEEQSGIFTSSELKVNVAHHTYLEGAYLLSNSDKLSLTTQTFSYKDKENKDYLSSKAISLSAQSDQKSISHSSTQIALSHQGRNTQGATLATLGKGEIHISNSEDSLKTINTDISKSTPMTEDKITGLLNINTQIDNRFFTHKGRESIYEDISSIPSNLIKTTNGAFTLAFNPLLSIAEVLLSPDISLKEILSQWKANQSSAVAINNLDRNILNELSSGQNIDDIESAIKGENQDRVHIYYDETDNLKGFYDNKNKQIYLNAANDSATDTRTFVQTYTHENAHHFTHNDAIANNAGSYGNFSYHLSNLLGFTPINTEGRTTSNHNNIPTTTTPISSKEWQQNQSNNIGFNHSNHPSNNDDFTSNTNNDKSNSNTYSTSNAFKDILDYNNYQASLVEDGDRDNNAAAILKGAGKIIQKSPQLKKLGEKGLEFAAKQVDKLKNTLGITKEEESKQEKQHQQEEKSKQSDSAQNSNHSSGEKKEDKGSSQESKDKGQDGGKAKESKSGDAKEEKRVSEYPKVHSKSSRKGGGPRERRVDGDGNIYEKDYMHSKKDSPVWEKYDKRGRHKGEVDDYNNETKKAKPNRRIEP